MQETSFGLIEVPKELLTAQKMVHVDMEDNISGFQMPLFCPRDVIVLSKLLFVAVMKLTKKPIFCDERGELKEINVSELEQISRDEDLDAVIDMQHEYFFQCLVLMNSLTMFGWKRLEELHFGDDCYSGDNLPSHDEFRNTHLSIYYEYFDTLVDEEKTIGGVCTHVYTFVNERLGNYQRYANEHEIDVEMASEITNALAQITGLFGVSFTVNSLRDYGYEVVYIHSCNPDNEQYDHDCFAYVNFLMPIHAANLEKLLDIAYELYPIEKCQNTTS